MQAIQTRFLSPTNSRGARIKAWCKAGSKTIAYNYELDASQNHYEAAMQLFKQCGWAESGTRTLWQGCLPSEDYCHVII
jgi:hypothetical protein